jgi:hypothetical protein
MEMGIAASIPCPTLRVEYADATVKITQNRTPQKIEREVTSGKLAEAGTIGRYNSPLRSG